MDVNNDGNFTAGDALAVINRLLIYGAGPLGPAPNGPHAYYDTNGDNILSASDALRAINELLVPPTATLTSLVPFSIDLTPQLTLTTQSNAGVSQTGMAHIDVDLNGDGDFVDVGETDYMTVPTVNGSATFDLTPALPPSGAAGPYTIHIRARSPDANAIAATSSSLPLVIDTSTSTALADYVNTPDDAYQYSLVSTTLGDNNAYVVYDLNMTSQTWRTTADVDHTVWQSRMQVVVPAGVTSTQALLLIDGGSIGDPPPGPNGDLIGLALQSHSVAVELKDVPNEPLNFTGDPNDPRYEDEAIAYTYDQFMQHLGDPNDNTWPLLLPMVKSAVRAMDTVQNFVPTVTNGSGITDFVVTGYSKRGWTTWLTATVDPRVEAIIPGVFDALNLAEQMVHHYGVYGFFSPAIQAYNDEHIFDRILTPAGQALSAIVDPYRYLAEPKMAMPKLMLDSTGDQFFVSDSAQYYYHDLAGSENYLRYIPNTGHGLDSRASDSTVTFYNAIVNNLPLPQYSWTVQPDGGIRVQTGNVPMQVLLWQATNPVARDFRQGYTNVVWTSSTLFDEGGGVYTGNVLTPSTGATAYMVELTFPSPILSNPYVFTTEIHVKTNLPLYAWPYASTIPVGGAIGVPSVASSGVASSSVDLNSVASGLFMFLQPQAYLGAPVFVIQPSDQASQSQTTTSTVAPVLTAAADNESVAAAGSVVDDPPTEDPTDLVFAGPLDDVLGA